jgi:hypothetical protein
VQITRQKLTKSTGSTASFEIHGKCMANTTQINFFFDNGASFDTSGAYIPLPMASVFDLLVNGNGIFVRVAGIVAVVFAITFYFQID